MRISTHHAHSCLVSEVPRSGLQSIDICRSLFPTYLLTTFPVRHPQQGARFRVMNEDEQNLAPSRYVASNIQPSWLPFATDARHRSNSPFMARGAWPESLLAEKSPLGRTSVPPKRGTGRNRASSLAVCDGRPSVEVAKKHPGNVIAIGTIPRQIEKPAVKQHWSNAQIGPKRATSAP